MEKHQTEKIRKIKAIPDRRIDFYYRLLNGPEQLKKRKKQRITAALVIAAFLAAGHVLGVLKHSEKEYQKTIAKLEAFLEDETNQAADESAKKLGAQVEKQDNMIFDMAFIAGKRTRMENAKANIYSYPLVTSDVFKTLEDCCPDKVLITITGYNCATGELQFDAVAPEVTDVSEVIEIWKTLDIFQGVYFTGYTQNQAQDGYTVKVVCILSEHAGRQAADEN